MDKQKQEHQWLEWAKELQFIAQAGLTYTKDPFDKERFERVREIAAEIMSLQGRLPLEQVKDLFCNETGFQTPKLDTRAAIFKDNKILLVKEKKWHLVYAGRMGRCHADHPVKYRQGSTGGSWVGCRSHSHHRLARPEQTQPTSIRLQRVQGICTLQGVGWEL